LAEPPIGVRLAELAVKLPLDLLAISNITRRSCTHSVTSTNSIQKRCYTMRPAMLTSMSHEGCANKTENHHCPGGGLGTAAATGLPIAKVPLGNVPPTLIS
jgi:hypothetical protein